MTVELTGTSLQYPWSYTCSHWILYTN